MTSLDTGMRTIRTLIVRITEAWQWYDSIPWVRRIHAELAKVAQLVADDVAAFVAKTVVAKPLLPGTVRN